MEGSANESAGCFEGRIAKLALNAAALPKLDAEFEEITEGEELTKKESRAAWDAARQTERSAARRVHEPRGGDCINLKSKWAALEALVGNPKRIALIAADLVTHWTPSPPAQSGYAQRSALSVSLSPLA